MHENYSGKMIYNTLKGKLIASFRNLKPYPSPLQNFAKQGISLLSHLTEETNIDINNIIINYQQNINSGRETA